MDWSSNRHLSRRVALAARLERTALYQASLHHFCEAYLGSARDMFVVGAADAAGSQSVRGSKLPPRPALASVSTS
jgi:hypothetical protein